MYARMQLNYILLVTFLLAIHECCGIRFYLQPHQKKCLRHEMYANQLAKGEYDITSLPGTVVDMSITDSKGHIALNRENIDGPGKFAVTSDGADIYDLCFTYTVSPVDGSGPPTPREVTVDFRVGAEAKEYETLAANHDKISELERDLVRIEDLTNSVIIDFAYLKKRGQEMHDTNDSTNTRLFYQTITSVIILLALTTWQILYLRTFFRTRKLID